MQTSGLRWNMGSVMSDIKIETARVARNQNGVAEYKKVIKK